MAQQYFIPWIGKNYQKARVLVMSESTYDWIGEDKQYYSPSPSHAKDSVRWHIEHFRQNRYFTALNRALCATYEPIPEEMQEAWDLCAYSVFVQESVGFGPGVRPSPEQWADASSLFLPFLEEIKPAKVILTGKDMWNNMPDTAIQLSEDVQAYRLSDGRLVWCLALSHPANRLAGFSWDKVSDYIAGFCATALPSS